MNPPHQSLRVFLSLRERIEVRGSYSMPRFRNTVQIDDYVLDILMRDIVGHDRQPAAYLVYVWLYGQAARTRWQPVPSSLRMLAESTGLSKSAVQTALELLRRRELIETSSDHSTAVPEHRVLRHWRVRHIRQK